jgi:hypothetical protein
MWLFHCATSRKVAGLIPDEVTEIFHRLTPLTMALGSTQPLTEISTRNISWGVKGAGAWGWQFYHFHVPTVWKSGSLNLLEPYGIVQACVQTALPSPLTCELLPFARTQTHCRLFNVLHAKLASIRAGPCRGRGMPCSSDLSHPFQLHISPALAYPTNQILLKIRYSNNFAWNADLIITLI